MRFFSNDSRDSADEQAQEERPDRVQSDPVAVPGQRPPSPWSNTPAEANTDDATATVPVRDDRDDRDQPEFHEPGPQPTAFGASTVGGAVAASAVANPLNDQWDSTDRVSAADSGVGDDRMVAPGDGSVESPSESNTRTYASNTATDDTRTGTPQAGPGAGQDDVVDVALDDHGTFDDPQVKDQVTETTTDTDAQSAPLDANPALKDEGGFDDPKAVDPVTDETLDRTAADRPAVSDASDASDASVAEDNTVVVAEPIAAAPAATTPAPAPTPATPSAPASEGFFAAADAQGFQERWRDVQLRFVDSPKEATDEAAKLVEEAVDRLTASLRSRKEGIAGDGDDTEALRVQLRGYRDILNRILGL
ncbi:hypothetical protein COUCH_32690 [Couchioplanes caeruleus]|uniref:hypothetical protein n=1 Tax=Couchioplanes caeruleus TaxID=56438 RepID=UPI0020BE4B4A|nr:hypothetical protein [Couchioplanes caeruleus]UQU68792.1 hypothetical protein COUCH_32690 [Couchioplanes caeruleus]